MNESTRKKLQVLGVKSSQNVIRIFRKWKNPFTQKDAAHATGVTRGQISITFSRLQEAGILKNTRASIKEGDESKGCWGYRIDLEKLEAIEAAIALDTGKEIFSVTKKEDHE